MISIEQRIKAAIEPIISTVVPEVYEGDLTEYCVFNYDEIPGIIAESAPDCMRLSVQLHWYLPRKISPKAKKAQIYSALLNAGFSVPQIINANDYQGQHYVFEFEAIGDA